MSPTSRRDLIKGTVLLPLAAQVKTPAPKIAGGSRPVVISSANGLKAVAKAYSELASGGDPLDAVISGVKIVEDDPEDVSVGYGGIPNEEGVGQLDASVMDGRTMKAGGVGAIENIKNPSKVARLVMERTNRVFLVGPGALKFARAHGFQEETLLTERSRKIWLYWKEKLSGHDDWIEAGNEEEKDPDILWFIKEYGASDFRPLLQVARTPGRFSGHRGRSLRGRRGRRLRFDGLGRRESAFLRLAHGRGVRAPGQAAGGGRVEDARADLGSRPGEPRRARPAQARLQHQVLRREQEGGVCRRRPLVRFLREVRNVHPRALRRRRRLRRAIAGVRLPLQAGEKLRVTSSE